MSHESRIEKIRSERMEITSDSFNFTLHDYDKWVLFYSLNLCQALQIAQDLFKTPRLLSVSYESP